MSTRLLADTQCDTCGRSVLVDEMTIAAHQEWVGQDLRQHAKDICTACQKLAVFYCPYCLHVHTEETLCEALRALLEVVPPASLFPIAPSSLTLDIMQSTA